MLDQVLRKGGKNSVSSNYLCWVDLLALPSFPFLSCSSVPVILEPHGLAQPLCCHTRTMANWLTADICTQCEHYLLNVASNQQQNIPLRRISQSWTKLE